LTDYDRIIVMDSDGLLFNNVDHLFTIPFPMGVKIAAPQGYWFDKQGHLPAEKECFGNLNAIFTWLGSFSYHSVKEQTNVDT